jgi:putative transposase
MFFSDMDRRLFLRYLEEGLEKSRSALHAFVLMTNHVHLLVTGLQAGSISRLMQSVGRRYARYVNRAYCRTGTLFEGRFKSSLVDTESYFFTCTRYIELNPVRAGLARAPIEYAWSSFAHNASGSPAWMLSPHKAYQRLGQDASSRAQAYQALFLAAPSDADLEKIRHAAAKGSVLGDAAFERRMELLLGRKVTYSPPGRPCRTRVQPDQPQLEM